VVLSLVAIGGMTLVLYEPGSGGQAVGIGLTLAGVACCAVYTIATRKLLGDEPTLTIVLAQQAAALALVVAGSVLIAVSGRGPDLAGVSSEAWLSALASGLVYYALAYWFYLTGLRRSTASFAAMAFYLIPIFGVTAGMALLGERLDPMQWLGVTIVLAALLGILLRSASGRPERTDRLC
jgi:drug/metabolite transporter (DMT)-like permease